MAQAIETMGETTSLLDRAFEKRGANNEFYKKQAAALFFVFAGVDSGNNLGVCR